MEGDPIRGGFLCCGLRIGILGEGAGLILLKEVSDKDSSWGLRLVPLPLSTWKTFFRASSWLTAFMIMCFREPNFGSRLSVRDDFPEAASDFPAPPVVVPEADDSVEDSLGMLIERGVVNILAVSDPC